MRRFGEGDRGIAQYVRKHYPEIIEEAVAAERRRKRRSAKYMRSKRHPVKAETATDRKARALIAELASLGVFVSEVPKNGTGTRGSSRSRLQLAGK